MEEGKKILIADDDAAFRTYLRATLEASNYTVLEAEDGMQALLRIMNEAPDLVLLDLNMPAISGYRVTELVRSVPEIRETPIIVISGQPESMQRREEILGARAFFNKPFPREALMSAVNEALARPILEIIEEAEGAAAPPAAGDDRGEEGEILRPDGAEALRTGQPEEAARRLRQALERQPGDLAAAGYLHLAESLIVRRFLERAGDPRGVVPRLEARMGGDLTRLSLNPAEGFLLAQIDGHTDLENLFHVSGMNRFRTCLLLEKLIGEGIVVLDGNKGKP